MKVAFSSSDAKRISSHFGRSRYFVVFTLENGKISGNEVRENPHAAEKHGEDHEHEHHSHHGMHHMHGHSWVKDVLGDCDIVITRGLGEGARLSLESLGKKVIVTNLTDFEEALRNYGYLNS